MLSIYQLWRFVRTSGQCQEQSRSPGEFCRSKYGCIHLTAVTSILVRSTGSRVNVVISKLIRNQQQLSAVTSSLGIILFERSTRIDRCMIQFCKLFVEVHHDIRIFLLETLIWVWISSLRFSKRTVSRSITLVFFLSISIVQSSACRYIQETGNIILQRCIHHITVFYLRTNVAVCNPVRVLCSDTKITRSPRLYVVAQFSIVAFEILFLFKVLASRIQVQSHDRVEISTVRQHVVGIFTYITEWYVHCQLILEQFRSIADHRIVTVILVVRHNSLRVNCRSRKISLVLGITCRKVERIGKCSTRIKEINRVEWRRSIQSGSPWRSLSRYISICILEFRHHKRLGELCRWRYIHACLSFSTFLCIDQDDSVRSTRTVQSGSRRSGQYRKAFNILRVKVGDTFTGSCTRTKSCTISLTVGLVTHRNTVNHIQYVVVTLDGLVTTHYYACTTSDTGSTTLDVHTSHLTVQAVYKVCILYCGNSLIVHFLHVIAQCFFRALDTQCSHHYLIKHFSVFAHYNTAHVRFYRQRQCFITHIRDFQRCRTGSCQCKITVDVCNRTVRCPLFKNTYPN